MEQYISGNLTYCPPGINVLDIWINHGFSKCFIETVSNGTVAIFLLIFGSIQLNIYRKYATPRPDSQLRASYLYELQLCLHLLVMLSPIARLIFQIYFDGEHVYGYMVRFSILGLKFPFSPQNRERLTSKPCFLLCFRYSLAFLRQLRIFMLSY